jgi:hypothetical protein
MPEEMKDQAKSSKSEMPMHHMHTWRPAWVVVGIFVALFVVFFLSAGMMHHREMAYQTFPSRDSYDMQDTGSRMGGDHFKGGMPGYDGSRGGRSQHELAAVTAINGNTLTVRMNGASVSVAITSTTSFYNEGDIAKLADLQIGDIITISGTPDSSGVIQATSITIQ